MRVVTLLVALLATATAYFALTLFVVQPIGAIPDGVTIVTWRREGTQFIDSADAVCKRKMGSVNLLCRVAAIGGIAKGDILLRLPYSRTLYLISTGGEEYER